VNPTNLCVNRCRFCAFSRSRGEEGAYELTNRDIIKKLKKIKNTKTEKNKNAFDEVHIVGGLHPDWAFEHYLEMLQAIKENFPGVSIKGFTAVEADYMRKKSGLPLREVFKRLKDSGLDVMPGGGAEIFHPDVRNALCPEKLSGKDWLRVMREAHGAGIKTNATMLYGHIENYEHRVAHLQSLRRLQDQTGGFQAFIPLPYQPDTEVGGHAPSGIEDLKCIAVSRIFLDNFDHVKAYWVMLGEKLSQVALLFGADDLEGTVIEERIAHSAGARTKYGLSEAELARMIKKAGKEPARRDSFYRRLS
jgi:aminodeoxyfutalosine synthase